MHNKSSPFYNWPDYNLIIDCYFVTCLRISSNNVSNCSSWNFQFREIGDLWSADVRVLVTQGDRNRVDRRRWSYLEARSWLISFHIVSVLQWSSLPSARIYRSWGSPRHFARLRVSFHAENRGKEQQSSWKSKRQRIWGKGWDQKRIKERIKKSHEDGT